MGFFLEGDAVARAMRVLDTDCDGKVSLAEMRDAVIAIYRERKNLAFTLKVSVNTDMRLTTWLGVSSP